MISVLLTSRDETSLSGLTAAFEDNAMNTARAESGSGALSMMRDEG